MVVLHYVPVVHFRPNVPFLIVLVKKSSVFSLAGIVTSVLLRLDILFLTKLRGVEATGIYAAAFKLVNPWTTVIASFTGIFYPLVSRHRRETSPEEFQKTCERYCRMVVLVAALAALFMICLSKELVLLLFRTAFADSAGVLTYLSFLLIPMCATPAFGMILAVGDKQKYDLLAIAVATGAACLLHYLLVRSFSYYGTVTAVILSFTIIMVIQVYFIRQEMFALRIGDVLLKPLAVFLIGLAVNQLMREISGWIKAPVVLSAALSAAIGLGLIKGREIQMIFKKKLSELGA
jgi:O-antigen/teichoic acid export membrane protein